MNVNSVVTPDILGEIAHKSERIQPAKAAKRKRAYPKQSDRYAGGIRFSFAVPSSDKFDFVTAARKLCGLRNRY